MAYSVERTTTTGDRPYWYQIDTTRDFDKATRRARNYALDFGGYVCVKDSCGHVVFGTDPAELDRAISENRNRDFSA